MIKITVVSYNNETPSLPNGALFGPEHGTIGRSEDNFLVLPDPKHYVSRAQAKVWSNGTRHHLINLSQANPIIINGQEIEAEREYDIHAGDQIKIGLYQLRVDAVAGTSGDLPPTAATPSLAKTSPTPAATEVPVNAATLSSTAEAARPADSAELLQAFLKGAGLPDLNLSSGLTPELMETMGKLVATSVQGTMDLIAQRALVKREVNADVTLVVLRKNNPLKFFPDSQTVLTQMLRKKMPGFMTPDEAMDDAFQDLRAHQLAVVAGMKAAMDALMKKFQPALFEKRLSPPTLLDHLNPARRKAAMWEHFSRLFDSISLESKDEFQTLFGKDFLTAYEKEIERIKYTAHTEHTKQAS
ncbi:type VI secretion system-associated FHA domain protein TagH [Undibacterium piscinae]|uniref:Type VI secretion system-associated FHA domain protein TagH n=1 Tax=Undibacterium piscinae TaxID=2495591 RepID=A0A6M4A0C7_9BURK|nr:type VI secretion system-associated FHA domain protein TagH [Undibacterium piscinae]